MKLQEAFNQYLLHLESQHYSKSHITRVDQRIGAFTRGPKQDTNIIQITNEDIHQHFIDLEDAGLAIGNLAGYKSAHRAFWRWCLDNKWITQNPSDVLLAKQHIYSFEPVHHCAADEQDFQTVIDALPSFMAHRNYNPRDVRDALIISITADSSARRGEIWKLRREHTERALNKGKLLANGRTVYKVNVKGKTAPFTIRFFDESADILRLWLNIMPKTAVHLFVSPRTGKRIRLDYMADAFKRICKYADVPTFRFQAVRKRDVTDMIQMSGDQKMGQLYAGHKSPRTTSIYYNDIKKSTVDKAASELANQRHGPLTEQQNLANQFFSNIPPT